MRRMNFQLNKGPSAVLTFESAAANIRPARVPSGQTYLQKNGVRLKVIGSMITSKSKTTYLRYLRKRSILNLFFLQNGILQIRSCRNPKGHRKPHMALPATAPKKIRSPRTQYGNLNLIPLKKLCKEPIGQEPTAPGQEQQLSPGTHTDFEDPSQIFPVKKPLKFAFWIRVAAAWIPNLIFFLSKADTLHTDPDCFMQDRFRLAHIDPDGNEYCRRNYKQDSRKISFHTDYSPRYGVTMSSQSLYEREPTMSVLSNPSQELPVSMIFPCLSTRMVVGTYPD